ncbi:NERD domain-containing protein [Lentibacillus lipolyticus]|nr:NERD domain-containing protein [Lentibacillus lipolyticus]
MYRYPGQFMRLKQEQWNKLYHLWAGETTDDETEAEEQASPISKWKALFKRGKRQPEPDPNDEETLPPTEEELKLYFLNRLYPLQLKWASSTVRSVSFMKQSYYQDTTLKYFLQRFPDTYLVMFYPIFQVKQAPIDGEIILISPVGIDIIYFIEYEPGATILAEDARTWSVVGQSDGDEMKILSPMLALKRTEQIVKSILHAEDSTFPITKVVLSRMNPIISRLEPYNTAIIGKQKYEEWFTEKRKLVSPLKSKQLEAAALLLKHCQTASVKRPEWEDDRDEFAMGE